MKNQRGVRINNHFAGNWGTKPHEIYGAAKARALSCINDPAPKLNLTQSTPKLQRGRPMKAPLPQGIRLFCLHRCLFPSVVEPPPLPPPPVLPVPRFSFPAHLRSLWRSFFPAPSDDLELDEIHYDEAGLTWDVRELEAQYTAQHLERCWPWTRPERTAALTTCWRTCGRPNT